MFHLQKPRFWISVIVFVFLANCKISLSLEANNPARQFSVISLPEEANSNNNVEEIETTPEEIESTMVPQPKLDVVIRIHDVRGDNDQTTDEPSSFSGIRDKVRIETPPKNSAVHISPRGRSGVVAGNGWDTQQDTVKDVPITWDEAYSQSVKRVVVRSRQDKSVPHHRNIVKLQPIVQRDTSMSSTQIVTSPSPPPHEEVAKMARFIVHNSNWTSLATISNRSPTTGFPFVNIFSVSDGTATNSSGIPYMYMTPLDVSVIDLKDNLRSSLTMSLAQGDYCKSQSLDPEDPRCAHVILTGNITKLKNSTLEANFAKQALFSRHPNMESWPKDHGWFFAKLEIAHILVLDYFGGAKSVEPEDYFSAEI